MGLLNPIWLWGMTALAVPVAIHLLSRKDVRVIQIGSLRHLEEAVTRQAIRIRLNAYLLLALRCAIVALTILILAGLFTTFGSKENRWVLIESGLEQNKTWRSVIDSLEANGYEARRLAPGFRILDGQTGTATVPDYWKLSDELAGLQLDRCVVISRARASGFSGYRPMPDPRITWLTAAGDSTRFVLTARVLPGDSIIARLGSSNEDRTTYTTVRLAASQARTRLEGWLTIPSPGTENTAPAIEALDQHIEKDLKPLSIVVSGSAADEEERRVVRAALNTVAEQGVVPIQIREVPASGNLTGDWLIWLSTDAPPTGVRNIIRKLPPNNGDKEKNGEISIPLLVSADEYHSRAGDSSSTRAHTAALNEWFITQPLTVSNAVRDQLPLQVATVLLSDRRDALQKRALVNDQRAMPEGEAFSAVAKSTQLITEPAREQKPASALLAVALVALLAAERFIANRQQL